MDSVNRFGPELILLAMAGVIILADLGWALAGTGAERMRRPALGALALMGAAATLRAPVGEGRCRGRPFGELRAGSEGRLYIGAQWIASIGSDRS